MLPRFAVFLFGLAGALLAAGPTLANPDDEPLARFEDPLCPGVVGLRREAAESMIGRIRANAETFGRRIADEETCEPNLLIAFVEDGQAFLNRLEDRPGNVFTEMSRQERERLLAEAGPVHVVTRVRSRSRDGLIIPRRDNLVNVPHTTMWSAHSKIYVATRKDIIAALVLFDRRAISGLTLDQLADYTTMRALARTLPEVESVRGESILALFSGEPRPAGLTEFDRLYLGTLYAGLPNMPGSAQLAQLEAATGRRVVAEE
jgi:hypothetical protein